MDRREAAEVLKNRLCFVAPTNTKAKQAYNIAIELLLKHAEEEIHCGDCYYYMPDMSCCKVDFPHAVEERKPTDVCGRLIAIRKDQV